MFGKRFEEDQELLKQAAQSEIGEKKLRSYLKPVVQEVIDEFLTSHPNVKNHQILEREAWKYLSVAVSKYLVRSERMTEGAHDIFYFATYFRWFVRQALIEYSDSLPKRDLNF